LGMNGAAWPQSKHLITNDIEYPVMSAGLYEPSLFNAFSMLSMNWSSLREPLVISR
jgi:hypothetical protein